MTDPKIIHSSLCRTVEENGESVNVLIYRLEDTEWSLEMVASDGSSTVWEDLFASDKDAPEEALAAIQADGVKSLSEAAAQNGVSH